MNVNVNVDGVGSQGTGGSNTEHMTPRLEKRSSGGSSSEESSEEKPPLLKKRTWGIGSCTGMCAEVNNGPNGGGAAWNNKHLGGTFNPDSDR